MQGQNNKYNQEYDKLIYMHQFYSEEARQQRSMMWETVKWFTPILTLIAGIWIKYFIDNYLMCKNISVLIVLFSLSFFGFILCLCCIFLLRSFYKTNLKYVSMFAKIEEEIKFDQKERSGSEYFPGDKFITWEEWRIERKGNKEKFKSVDYLNDKVPESFWHKPFRKITLACLMQWVFIFFAILFFLSVPLLIWNIFR